MRKKLLFKAIACVSIVALFSFSNIKAAKELVKGGNMEEASAWNVYWGTNGNDTGVYEFNYTAKIPTAGEGGCYRVKAAGQSASFLWQPVTIIPGHKYLIKGAYRNISVDTITNTWVELFLTRAMPAGGEVSTGIGYSQNTWMAPDTLNFDGTFEDDFALANTASKVIEISDTVTQTEWYLVLKAGCWNTDGDVKPAFDLVFDQISLTDQSIINNGSDMEDASAWNVYWGTNGNDTGVYEFNYTAKLPAAGDGGCYRVKAAGQSASFLWQPVNITPGHKYIIEGAYKNVSVDTITNTWVELFLTRAMPAGGEVSTGIGYSQNTWMAPDTLNFDGTFEDDFALANTASKYIVIPDTVTQAEWYLVLKAGCWNTDGDVKPAFDLLFDNIKVSDLGLFQDTHAPTAPANLAAIVNGAKVTLTWDASTDDIGVVSYNIYSGGDLIGNVDAKASGNKFITDDLTGGDYTFGIEALDLAGNVSDKTTVNVTVVSVRNNTIAILNVYPNPTSDIINVKSVNNIEYVAITNITGQVVEKIKINSNTAQINLKDLNSGLYFVTVKQNKGSQVLRIVKR